MLLEFTIIYQIALLLLFYQAYQKRDEILWAMSAVLSGALTFLFFSFSTNDTAIVAAFNFGLFTISLVWFFIDLFSNRLAEVFRTNKLRFPLIKKKKIEVEKDGITTNDTPKQ